MRHKQPRERHLHGLGLSIYQTHRVLGSNSQSYQQPTLVINKVLTIMNTERDLSG